MVKISKALSRLNEMDDTLFMYDRSVRRFEAILNQMRTIPSQRIKASLPEQEERLAKMKQTFEEMKRDVDEAQHQFQTLLK